MLHYIRGLLCRVINIVRFNTEKPPRRKGPWNGLCEIRPEGEATAKYACGHDGPCQATAVFWGEEKPIKEDRDPSQNECPQCLFDKTLRVSIRCCLCGGVIIPGAGVALYDPEINPQIGRPAWATAVQSGELIGCMRWDCCPSGAFFAGHWSTDGFRPAFEGHIAGQEALRTGKVVIAEDI